MIRGFMTDYLFRCLLREGSPGSRRFLLDCRDMRRLSWTPLVAAALAAAPATPARAEVYGNNFRSAAWGVEMTVPRDWELSEQMSYPGILAFATHHKYGGRILLAVQKLAPGETAKTYAERNEKSLKQIGYRVAGVTRCRSATAMLDATVPDRQHRVLQAYLVKNDIGYVLTLAAPAKMIDSYQGAFCDTLSSLVFPAPPSTPPPLTPPPSTPPPSTPNGSAPRS
jgi:hypothetical protein